MEPYLEALDVGILRNCQARIARLELLGTLSNSIHMASQDLGIPHNFKAMK